MTSPPLLTDRAAELASALVALAPRALERFLDERGLHQRRVLHDDGTEHFEDHVPEYSHPDRYALMVRIGLRAWIAALPASARDAGASSLDDRYARSISGRFGTSERALDAWRAADFGRALAHEIPSDHEIAELDTQGVSWWLVAATRNGRADDAERIATELRARADDGGLFRTSRAPGHAHFNSQAYAIHALATHAAPRSLEIAERAAATIVALQGPLGQWWWLYDPARGVAYDRYPVYSVHQAGMAPMALGALAAAGGTPHRAAMERSLRWLFGENELGVSLVRADRDAVLRAIRRSSIWSRRIAPGLARRGLASLNRLLPGKEINPETRPYDHGWALLALAPLLAEAGAGS